MEVRYFTTFSGCRRRGHVRNVDSTTARFLQYLFCPSKLDCSDSTCRPTMDTCRMDSSR